MSVRCQPCSLKMFYGCGTVGDGAVVPPGGSKISSAVETLARCRHDGCVEDGVQTDVFLHVGTGSGPSHLSRRLVTWMGPPSMMVWWRLCEVEDTSETNFSFLLYHRQGLFHVWIFLTLIPVPSFLFSTWVTGTLKDQAFFPLLTTSWGHQPVRLSRMWMNEYTHCTFKLQWLLIRGLVR